MTEPHPSGETARLLDSSVKKPACGPVQTYDRVEAAAKLGVSVDWLREHHDEIPHLRLGRLVRFTDAHLEQIQRDREVQPTRPPTTSLGGQPRPRPYVIRRRRTLGGGAA